ncbi:type II toxin-antitoxin system RelE family toxin [Rubrobacter indicoceani]|uniref:type II toxin-antitoxin system RelE family toxin n=1 Tax=Rubrobacter indicoceani TaxID=2051957 RepID=UPI000E5A374C|nr:type II toxin-antitoxin system RelE/ParE family toxin [Rubrobacter indicoceani]
MYRIIVERTAEKALKKRVRPDEAERIRAAVDLLAEDPHPAGSIKLRGRDGYRLRVGDYRIIYEVEEASEEVPATIYVEAIGHRQGIYDG